MKVCENGHAECCFPDHRSCPVCNATAHGETAAEKLRERIKVLENEIDHLYVCVVNQKGK